MYSIKHVTSDKKEVIHAVVSYEFDPMKGLLVGHGCPSTPDGEISFSSGRAYAMNDQGQTVGIYNLNVNLQQ